jgi:hypothetical protein
MNDTNAKSPMFDTAPEATSAASRRRKRGVRVTTAAAVALGLAAGGATVAGAASTASSPPARLRVHYSLDVRRTEAAAHRPPQSVPWNLWVMVPSPSPHRTAPR